MEIFSHSVDDVNDDVDDDDDDDDDDDENDELARWVDARAGCRPGGTCVPFAAPPLTLQCTGTLCNECVCNA